MVSIICIFYFPYCSVPYCYYQLLQYFLYLVFAILGRDRKRFEKMLLITFFEDRSKVLQRHLKLRSFEKPCFGKGLEMCKLQQEISGTRNDACSANAVLAQI